jgi:predicted nucleic acid-binding protein
MIEIKKQEIDFESFDFESLEFCWQEKTESMVDAGVFIAVILGECEAGQECKEELESFPTQNKEMLISPIIDYEVIKRIEEELNETCSSSSFSSKAYASRYRRSEFDRFFTTYSQLAKEAILVFGTGIEFRDILAKCIQELRVEIRDIYNIAIAISNGCSEFITTDTRIKEDERTIQRIAQRMFKVTLL